VDAFKPVGGGLLALWPRDAVARHLNGRSVQYALWRTPRPR
jgi:hypothetical protein